MVNILEYQTKQGKTFEIRSFQDEEDNPWWAAADICKPLGIKNAPQALARLDAKEKQTLSTQLLEGIISNDTLDPRIHELSFVNESGLYGLIFQSRKPEAKRFQKWITAEVLPAIRQTGRYDLFEAQAEKLSKHEKRDVQIESSKELSKFVIERYGVNGVVRYHSWTSLGLTGRKPAELQEEAKALKIPYKARKTGRECIRTFWPATAVAASVQDELVAKEGIDPHDAHEGAKLLEPYLEFKAKIGALKDASVFNNEASLFPVVTYLRKPRKLAAGNLPNPFPPNPAALPAS